MSSVPKHWRWTQTTTLAAQLMAEDKISQQEMAKQLGVSTAALYGWRQVPEFQERVEELLEAYKARVRRRSIALLERRIDTYMDDFDAIQTIQRERGLGRNGKPLSDKVGEEGGRSTGLICVDYKGKDADRPVYKFDKAIIDSKNDLRKLLAQELGQFQEKSKQEHTGPGGGPIVSVVVNKTDMEL